MRCVTGKEKGDVRAQCVQESFRFTSLCKFGIKSKNIYAVVHGGFPYIKTDYGYYPLTRKNNDFFFVGRARMTANSKEVTNAIAFYGFIGGIVATHATSSFEMKIDHLNGGFIRIRERELF